jgi:hypothetical protein
LLASTPRTSLAMSSAAASILLDALIGNFPP